MLINRLFSAADTNILSVVYVYIIKRYSVKYAQYTRILIRILVYCAYFTACMDVYFNFLRINIEWPGDEASPAAQSELLNCSYFAGM